MHRFTATVVLAFSLASHCTAEPGPATHPFAALTNAQLIDGLTHVTDREFSLRTNIIANGKDGNEELPPGLLKLQDPAPRPAEAMTELEQRGAAAVPDLCAHLDDARKTAAVIEGMGSGVWYSAEYDRNLLTGPAKPVGVCFADDRGFDFKADLQGDPDRKRYEAKVGDLCFEIVGRIVNRGFRAVRYQPSAIIIVNSTVACPALRDAVRSEWARLTPERHRALLVSDVERPDVPGRDAGGVWTLWTYYPVSVPAAVRARLSREVIARPKADADDAWSTAHFIDALQGVTSAEVDAAVRATFDLHNASTSVRVGGDDQIAVACVKHLAHKGDDDPLFKYCRRRAGQVGEKYERDRFDALCKLLREPQTRRTR